MSRFPPLVALTLLGIVFFAPLVFHPSQILYSDHSDLLAVHLPCKWFLVRSWQETGEVPLWCPESFAGLPFLHDINVAAFYAAHLPLYLLRQDQIGAAMSWIVVTHVLLAGWGMYLYSRSRGLDGPAALVAAVGYMFAGKWLLHTLGAGQYMTIGLAWVPWVVLGLESAVRQSSWLRATWAGVAFALLVMVAHPQLTLYAGLFVALWTLGPALEQAGVMNVLPSPPGGGEGSGVRGSGSVNPLTLTPNPSPPLRGRGEHVLVALARWAGLGAWTAIVAAGLAMVQLLPLLEAAGQGSRAGGVGVGEIVEGGVRSLIGLVGPAVTATPPGMQWEDRGGFGLLWLAAAVCAPLLCGRRVRFEAGVALALVVFALGGALLCQWLPGFRLFRIPSRMLLLLAFPVAYLTGETTQALFRATEAGDGPRRCQRVLLRVAAAVLILAGGFALRMHLEGKPLVLAFYWVSLLVTVPAAYWLLGRAAPFAAGADRVLWVGLLLIDVWALAWPLVEVRPEAEIYPLSSSVQYLADPAREPGRVLDRDVSEQWSGTPLGTGAPLALRYGLEPLRGFNSVDILRYKEYLQFVGDQDEPLRPLESPLTFPVLGNFPVVNKPLLDLLGTRYLLQPSDQPVPDGWEAVHTDPHPRAYDFITGGMQELPSYTVYRNRTVLPRAFLVAEARPLPERSQVLSALKATDFRRTVLLEDDTESSKAAGPAGTAAVREATPNRIVVDLDGTGGGYLVFADIWFPGWKCTVDGQPVVVHRADFLFRAVRVPAGARKAEFRFEPASYHVGRAVSLLSVVIVLAISLMAWAVRLFRRLSRA